MLSFSVFQLELVKNKRKMRKYRPHIASRTGYNCVYFKNNPPLGSVVPKHF